MDKPFGHSAIVRCWKSAAEKIDRQIHRRGSLRTIQRAARLLSGFIEIVSIEPYTREQYLRVFGDGTEHGPYRRRQP